MSFLGDLASIGSKATLRHFAIGEFTLDVVTEEAFQKTASKTQSAVESGARIVDHRIINPNEIMIRGTVVNYEIYDFMDDVFPQQNAILDSLDLPVSISAVTDYTRATVNRYAGTVKKGLEAVNKAKDLYGKIGSLSSLKDLPSLLNDNSQTDDRITRIKNTLEQIQASELLIEVMTSTGVYKNIQIDSIAVVRSSHGSAEFQIALSEMPTYDIEIVGGIDAQIKAPSATSKTQDKAKESKPQGKDKDKVEKAKVQSAKPQNKGKTVPQKSKKSALKTIIEGSKGLF